jgi:hypothetical protein
MRPVVQSYQYGPCCCCCLRVSRHSGLVDPLFSRREVSRCRGNGCQQAKSNFEAADTPACTVRCASKLRRPPQLPRQLTFSSEAATRRACSQYCTWQTLDCDPLEDYKDPVGDSILVFTGREKLAKKWKTVQGQSGSDRALYDEEIPVIECLVTNFHLEEGSDSLIAGNNSRAATGATT